MPSWLQFVLISAAKSVVVIFILLTAVAYAVWLERKVVGRMQNRWGPTRVGPFGLLQPLADGLKFILKEDIIKLQHNTMTTREKWRGHTYDFYKIGHEHLYVFRKPAKDEKTTGLKYSKKWW